MALWGVAAGAAVGLVIFQASKLSGWSLYALVGASAGAAAALVMHGYHQTTSLAEVKLMVPQLSEVRFVVTRDSQTVAWKLFVEAATRTSTQALAPDAGLLREALTSLYALFGVTRETLKEAQPSRPGVGPTVEHLAITMLNRELRPFLSRWHPRLQQWEQVHPDELAWPEASQCRAELAALQSHLREYVIAYGRLAGVHDPATTLGPAGAMPTG
jgi:hypothetical protein